MVNRSQIITQGKFEFWRNSSSQESKRFSWKSGIRFSNRSLFPWTTTKQFKPSRKRIWTLIDSVHFTQNAESFFCLDFNKKEVLNFRTSLRLFYKYISIHTFRIIFILRFFFYGDIDITRNKHKIFTYILISIFCIIS